MESLWPILQVVFGIGLVIFVHEAGHFVAARWCKVRVHVFSLGFGPRLLGWTKGHTEYKISAVPLGGYVRMAGDESAMSGGEPEPWELGAKSVGQRFLIYSGVVANVLFGLVVFPILFAVGIPSISPVVGSVEPGSPAWEARLEPGTRVLAVNGEEIYDLFHVAQEVAYSGDREVELEVVPPGEEVQSTLRLRPTYAEELGAYSIGMIGPSLTPDLTVTAVAESGAAARAGVRGGDTFVRVEGQPAGLHPEEQLTRVLRRGRPFQATFERDGEPFTVELEPRPAESGGYKRLGIVCPYRHLAGLRESALTRATGLAQGDRIVSIGGRVIFTEDDLLDALAGAEGPIDWVVRRDGEELLLESPELTAAERIELYRDLFVKPDEESTLLVVSPDEAAEAAGLRTGDRVLEIDGKEIANYEQTRQASRDAAEVDRPMLFKISRRVPDRAEPEIREFQAAPALWSPGDPGFGLNRMQYTYRVTEPWQAIRLGARSCWGMLRDVGRTLRGIMRQEVSGKSVGGIITISVFAHDTAKAGWVKFFWFLCLLSMNLAFLNVLPIPLLDGGHLFFLLVEGIKGSPVSERILSYSQLVGLVLIVSIFVFVIYNDLSRFDFFNVFN